MCEVIRDSSSYVPENILMLIQSLLTLRKVSNMPEVGVRNSFRAMTKDGINSGLQLSNGPDSYPVREVSS